MTHRIIRDSAKSQNRKSRKQSTRIPLEPLGQWDKTMDGLDSTPQPKKQSNGFTIIDNAYRDKIGPDYATLAVYWELARHHNSKTGLCCPSQLTIGELLGMDPKTVRKCIRKLMALQLVTVRKQKGGVNLYTVKHFTPQKGQGKSTLPPRENLPTNYMSLNKRTVLLTPADCVYTAAVSDLPESDL